MSSGHIVKSFDEELEEVRNTIVEMGGLAESQLEAAVRSLTERNTELALKTIEADKAVDELELSVDNMSIRLLALRNPVADDLRLVISALKIASLLERVADYAANISKRVIALNLAPSLAPISSIPRMGEMVRRMIDDTLKAYTNGDSDLAFDVWKRDQEVDQLYNSMFRELLTFMMEDPRSITSCTHLIFMAKNIERIGDHMTNIAEIIIYQVTGELPKDPRPKGDKTSVTMIENEKP
ncbi:phosphate signaling complex protein PhoU [Sneathiella sp. CAU 1612]|jgi:phosphate transport system protein|uniref:Phosphate-specific transport system accessory protein PhoU n=1 Tax=Sneathiella sedimenti TaxID=2816034 RepID=A0ABS3F579_9PROT|nr:phosphate signaling complex protein PhoU [Sneathiella sedimenti]MBO0333675.1 phosphate signaling complex protein PhoU [Sneathiella sedimenti]